MEREDLYIRLKAQSWDDYYGGKSNVKYPPVVGLALPEAFLPKDETKDETKARASAKAFETKVKLLNLMLQERTEICKFNPTCWKDPFQLLGTLAGKLLVLVPSGGKNAAWLGGAIKTKSFWWAKLLSTVEVQVLFLVSEEECDSYASALKSHNEQCAKLNLQPVGIIGYDGFGIGCGRAAAVAVARKLDLLSIIADDRSKAFTFSGGAEITEWESFKELFKTHRKVLGKKWITSVGPFGPCQVLTIFNPNAKLQHSGSPMQPPRLCFPPQFIASKEDMALECCLDTCGPLKSTTEYLWQLSVKTDTKNPAYQNTAYEYSGRKEKTLTALLKSKLYRSLEGDVLDWATLKGTYGFKNMWDGIKLQESAMYILLKEISEEVENGGDKALFDRLILPFFDPK